MHHQHQQQKRPGPIGGGHPRPAGAGGTGHERGHAGGGAAGAAPAATRGGLRASGGGPERGAGGPPGGGGSGGSGGRAERRKINEIRPYMKQIDCVFIVLEKGTTHTTHQGTVVNWLVADETASIYFSVWGDNTGGETLKENDIIQLRAGYATLFQGKNLILYAGRYGSIQRIGEFTMLFTELPNMSEIQWEFDPQHPGKTDKLIPVWPSASPALSSGATAGVAGSSAPSPSPSASSPTLSSAGGSSFSPSSPSAHAFVP